MRTNNILSLPFRTIWYAACFSFGFFSLLFFIYFFICFFSLFCAGNTLWCLSSNVFSQASVQSMDRIFVLHEGKLVHQGSHDELVEKKAAIYMKLLGLPLDDTSAAINKRQTFG